MTAYLAQVVLSVVISYAQPAIPARAPVARFQAPPPPIAAVDALVYKTRPDGSRWFSGVTEQALPLIRARVAAGLQPFTPPPPGDPNFIDQHPLKFF